MNCFCMYCGTGVNGGYDFCCRSCEYEYEKYVSISNGDWCEEVEEEEVEDPWVMVGGEA